MARTGGGEHAGWLIPAIMGIAVTSAVVAVGVVASFGGKLPGTAMIAIIVLGLAPAVLLGLIWRRFDVTAPESEVTYAPVVPAPVESRADAAADSRNEAMLAELRAELDRCHQLEAEILAAKQAAEAANMAKGEFLATMSHEMRTPLNGIIPLLDILRGTKLEADQREYLNTAYTSSRQLLSIMDDILDYSKIEANKLTLENVGLNVKDVVAQVIKLMEKSAEAKGLLLVSQIDPGVRLAARGDPVRLRQVLTNLVSNAIKFTEKGQITVAVSKGNDTRSTSELVFSVKDTGLGITPEVQARLFQPFTQADASTTRLHGGTGLGLVICKRIVDLMGGRIGLKSEVGRGSVFWFTAPLLKAVGDMPAARRDLNGARGMVIASDAVLVRRLTAYFANWGVNHMALTTTADAQSKLRAAASMGESWAYDFAIVDAGSLKSSAAAFLRGVQREGSLDPLKILVVQPEEGGAQELKTDDRITLLPRTFAEGELRTQLNQLLDVSDGSGPRVSLVAPSEKAQSLGAASGSADTSPIQGHVLLVEDNPVNRQVAQRLLGIMGLSLAVAEHGKQALELLERDSYDAILMDCQMPIMDGYSATRERRRAETERKLAHMPIIAMTANAMAGDREKCLSAGMDDYLTKPLNRGLLEETLRKWLPAGARTRAASGAAAVQQRPQPALAAGGSRKGETAARPAVSMPAAAPSTNGRKPALDEGIVRDLLDVMGSEFADLVKVYLEDAPRAVAQILMAAERNQVEALIAPSHSLKSTSANLGALALSELSKRIEHGARKGELGDPKPLAIQLRGEFERVAAELKRLLSASN